MGGQGGCEQPMGGQGGCDLVGVATWMQNCRMPRTKHRVAAYTSSPSGKAGTCMRQTAEQQQGSCRVAAGQQQYSSMGVMLRGAVAQGFLTYLQAQQHGSYFLRLHFHTHTLSSPALCTATHTHTPRDTHCYAMRCAAMRCYAMLVVP